MVKESLNLGVFFCSSRRRHTICALVTGVQTCALPISKPQAGGVWDKTTRGARQYLKTPRLRGLLAVTLAAAAASAMVIVNTPVLVRGALGLDQSAEIGRASCRERVCRYV